MTDQAAVASQIIAHNRNRDLISVTVHISTTDVECITSQSTDQRHRDIVTSPGNEERVIPSHGIQHQMFDPFVGNRQAAAVDPLFGDNEIFTKFSAHDGKRIQPVTPGNVDRCVDRVGNEVGTLTSVNVGVRSLGIVRIDAHKRSNKEVVIVGLPIQREFGGIAIDRKCVGTVAAVQGGRFADAITEESQCRQHCGEVVGAIRNIGVGIPFRFKHLPDLEGVVTSATPNIQDRIGVVEDKRIIALIAVHKERFQFRSVGKASRSSVQYELAVRIDLD